MKRILVIVLILIAQVAIAQPFRLHLGGGFSNYSGDLQPSRFGFNQARGVMSAGASYNLTRKIALRADYSFAKIGADDKKSNNAAFVSRNLNFQTIIQELAIMAEYNLFDLTETSFTPYAFVGIGVFHASPYTFDSLNRKIYLAGVGTEGQGLPQYAGRKPFKTTQFNVPVGGGLKLALSDDVHVGFEIGVRFIGSDYLDDVSRTYIDRNLLSQRRGPLAVSLAHRGDELKPPTPYPAAGTARGTVNGNDYYYFGQFRISFRMNWFDKNNTGGQKSFLQKLGCPRF